MSKEALTLALEAFEMYCEHGAILRPLEIRDAIKEALAKQAQVEHLAMQVRPSEFAELIKGKETVTGIPAYWAEWPNKEKL